MQTLIKIRNLSKHYKVGNKVLKKENGVVEQPKLIAVDNVSLDINKGEILGIVGESGCGKSTLGRCIMKLIDITNGEIEFNGQDIAKYNFKQMKPIREKMQMIFQNPYSSFNPKHTIGKNIHDVAKFYGISEEKYKEKMNELLSYIGMREDALKRYPSELSGGQLQRFAIVRALLLNPDFIMADEIVSALDVSVQAQILNLIIDLKEKYHTTMMFIAHELTVVQHVCDRVAVMYLGAIVELGTSEQLFNNAFHPYTQALISARPKELPELESNRMILKGDVPSAINIPKGCRFHTRCPKALKGLCDIDVPTLHEIESGHFVACHLDKHKNLLNKN